MGEAFFWGVVAGSSLVLGGVIGLRFSISPPAGNGGVGLGLLAGSAVFFSCEVLIERRHARVSRISNGRQASGVGGALVRAFSCLGWRV